MCRMSLLFLCTLIFSGVVGQITLTNPSFEEKPGVSNVPYGWVTCTPGSTPDILPGKWGVNKSPQQGMGYLGLITRENGSNESIGQKLKKPLDANSCYTFSVYLSRSESYSGYNLPLRLKIWGSKKFCGKEQLLVSTKGIKHTEWIKYDFQIYTKTRIHFIVLEACKAPGITIPYRGNILIDNISEIKPCFKAEINHRNRNSGSVFAANSPKNPVPGSVLLPAYHSLQYLFQTLMLQVAFQLFLLYQ